MWYSVLRKRERGIFIGTTAMLTMSLRRSWGS
jgi:hypothetical protein